MPRSCGFPAFVIRATEDGAGRGRSTASSPAVADVPEAGRPPMGRRLRQLDLVHRLVTPQVR
ncbi:MAG TPA: hypothetical protein VF802_03000, partial [Candidatus Limnocylindrales bacterium]